MTRDDIIRMAREAGFNWAWISEGQPRLERFYRAAYAAGAAAEREKVAQWMIRNGYATGHGDTIEDLLNELEWQVAEREREACAEIAEKQLRNTAMLTCNPPKSAAAWDIRNAIRTRGET